MEKETIWRVPSLERDMNRVDNNTATSLNEKFISPPEKKSTNKDSIVRIINSINVWSTKHVRNQQYNRNIETINGHI